MTKRRCFLCGASEGTISRLKDFRNEDLTCDLCAPCETSKGCSFAMRQKARKMLEMNDCLAMHERDPMRRPLLRQLIKDCETLASDWLICRAAAQARYAKVIVALRKRQAATRLFQRTHRFPEDVKYRVVCEAYGTAQILKSVPAGQKFRMWRLSWKFRADDGTKKGGSLHLSTDKTRLLHIG